MALDTLTDLEIFAARFAKPTPSRQRASIWPLVGLALMWAGILAWQAVRGAVVEMWA